MIYDLRFTICAVLGLILSTFVCQGQLTARVTPGYVFAEGERPTVGTLNQLGGPSIEITGTVDGSTGLSAGSVTGTILADSVVDDISLNYTNSSPRALQIKPYGITTNRIATNSIGAAHISSNVLATASGLSGGHGTQITLNINTNFFFITNNTVDLKRSVITQNSLPSSNVARTNGHGLGLIPSFIRVVIARTNGTEEIPIENVYASTNYLPVAHVSADDTAVYTTFHNGASNFFVRSAIGGSPTNLASITKGNFEVKIYARP
jgi:hypothetical protein